MRFDSAQASAVLIDRLTRPRRYIAAKRDRYERVQVPWITPAEVA